MATNVKLHLQELLIGGRWTAAAGGATYESLDPYTGDPATRAAAATKQDVLLAVQAARDAFPVWAALPPSERFRLLMACAYEVEKHASEISEAVTAEMGGPSG